MNLARTYVQKLSDYCLRILMVCTLLAITPLVDANSNNSRPSQIDLRYESIQPLISPQNLDPHKVVLGENLFHDNRLSKDNAMSCMSYHDLNYNGVDQGRFNTTKDERHQHVFRVPNLRLATLTPPYLHNGIAKTLEQAIRIMAKHQPGRNIPESDIKLIVSFLETLPGEYLGRMLSTETPEHNLAETP